MQVIKAFILTSVLPMAFVTSASAAKSEGAKVEAAISDRLEKADLIGHWQLVAGKRNDGKKLELTPDTLVLMEIRADGSILRTQESEPTLRLANEDYGKLTTEDVGYPGQLVIDVAANVVLAIQNYYDEIGFNEQFDAVAKLALDQKGQLEVIYPHRTSIYKKTSAHDAIRLIQMRQELIALAERRADRLLNLVKGKTFELVEVETTEIDLNGTEEDSQIKPASQVLDVQIINRNDKDNSNKSDDQFEVEKRGPLKLVNIKSIQFEGAANPRTLKIVVNGEIRAEMFLHLNSESGLLETDVYAIDSKGKPAADVFIDNGGQLFLKGERLEFRSTHDNFTDELATVKAGSTRTVARMKAKQ